MRKQLVRFGISLDQQLLQTFDRYLMRKGYATRSEAIRDLIREALVAQEWRDDQETVGTITLVYVPHRPGLVRQLTEVQHRSGSLILANAHVHLDAHHCLEVIIVRGKSTALQALANSLISTKGVLHGKLTMTTTGIPLT
ncbi:MAG: nickel-responsive transcriptional regulator NikR [Nitrospirae bacterium]|nr:MAG: nickel-responsive transcriptional regulator NikR [Nitrospirota bacterium]